MLKVLSNLSPFGRFDSRDLMKQMYLDCCCSNGNRIIKQGNCTGNVFCLWELDFVWQRNNTNLVDRRILSYCNDAIASTQSALQIQWLPGPKGREQATWVILSFKLWAWRMPLPIGAFVARPSVPRETHQTKKTTRPTHHLNPNITGDCRKFRHEFLIIFDNNRPQVFFFPVFLSVLDWRRTSWWSYCRRWKSSQALCPWIIERSGVTLPIQSIEKR